MKRPANISNTPKGDWTFTEPATGMKFKHVHWKAMEAEVFQHRLANPDLQLDVSGGWQDRLWDQICQGNEYLPCEDTEDKGSWPNMVDVFSWVKSMAHWAAGGLQVVPQAEAERRAATCIKCPNNQQISGCMGCRGAGELISNLTGGRTTSLDDRLHACRACAGCSLVAKVHLPLEVIPTEGLDLPSFCWMKL